MIQNKSSLWTVVQMYCPNCGTLNVGYTNEDGRSRFQCQRCQIIMVRSYKNRRHDLIEVMLPKGAQRKTC